MHEVVPDHPAHPRKPAYYETGRPYLRRTSGLGPIVKDLGSAVAAAWAVYWATLRDAFVMDWTQQQATMQLADRLKVIDLG